MLARYDFVLDTSAWAAFFEDSTAGSRIEALLIGSNVATSVLSVAELADYYARHEELAPLWDEDFLFVQTATDLVPVTPPMADAAGKTKTLRRKVVSKFGLLDALILETARAYGAVLVTTDADFKGMPGVEWHLR
jgi:predicted nucleic acid-binding protein